LRTARTVETILDTIGDTPLLELQRVVPSNGGRIFVKLEANNPSGSVKDRIGLSMIRAAEASGALKPGMTIVEPTSGNTGIALAMAAAALGYELVLTMPDSMSVERQQVMASFGAELVLTPGHEDMPGAIRKAEALKASKPDQVFMPQQFANPANLQIHYQTTGPEIYKGMDGEIDAFVAGVGTGGTITGVGKFLRQHLPRVRIVAVEPKGSAVLSGGPPGLHGIQGIGAGFVPELLDLDLVDEILTVDEQEAFHCTRRLAREEGLLVGPSAGANVVATLRLAEGLPKQARLVTILCDTGFRYFSVEGFIDPA
jgi:cysteine synthase A